MLKMIVTVTATNPVNGQVHEVFTSHPESSKSAEKRVKHLKWEFETGAWKTWVDHSNARYKKVKRVVNKGWDVRVDMAVRENSEPLVMG